VVGYDDVRHLRLSDDMASSGSSQESHYSPHGLFELHRTLDEVSTLIYVKDRDLRIVSANLAFCKALGVSREELLGQTTDQFLGEAGPASALIDHEVITSGAPRLGVVESYPAADGLHWVVTDKAPILSSDGRVVGLVGTSIDIAAQRESDDRLRQSEAQLRFLTANTADVIWTMDLEFRTTYISPSVERVLGFTPDEWMQLPFDRMSTPESVEREYAALQRELTAEASGATDPHRTFTIEVEMNHKDGSTVWMEMVIRAIRDDTGKLIGMVGVSRDITERRKVEKALRESGEKYRALFEQSVDAINLVAPDGRILDANPAWFVLFGYTVDDLPSFNARDAYVDPAGRERFLQAIAGQDRVDDEQQFQRKDGAVFDCRRVVTVRRAADGSVFGFQTVFHDVTETKKAEQALRESERRFRDLFELSRDAIYLVRPDGRFIYVNQAWLDLLGCTREDVSNYDAAHWYANPEGRTRYLERMAEAGDMLDDEVQLRRKDGSVFVCHRRIVSRKDEHGNTIAFHGVMRDVTEQKRAEQALHASEEKFRALFEQSIAPISLISPDGRLIEANDAWFHLLGYSREDMASFNAADLFPSTGMREEFVQRLLQCGSLTHNESRVKTRDGTFIDVVRSVSVRYNPDGSVLGYQTVLRDVTAEKAAEQALRESEEKYRQIFNQSIAAISLLAPDGHLIDANDAWFRLFGYSREDAPSIRAADLYLTPELRAESVRRLLSSGSLVDDEEPVKKKDGTLIDALRSMVVRYNPDGSVLGYQTVWLDITELNRTRDELVASHEQLRKLALRIQDVREEERTTIARELHDHFSQELTALKLDLDTLTKSGPPAGDSGLVRIRGIIRLVDQMSQELRQVITEMRPGMLDDLGLCAAIDWQAGQFSERSGMACHLNLTANDAMFSPELNTTLFRVLQEVLSNVARHSGAKSVRISLTSTSDSACLTVADDGRGITDGEASSPSSLGILGIKERLHACGGTLEIKGAPGLGSTVTATAPIFPTAGQWQTRLGLH
jgi:PAS domain S-box-containing protein